MKKILKFSLLLVATTMMFSCEKEQIKPTEKHEHGHEQEEELSKVQIIFTEGHTHGTSFHGDAQYVGLKYLTSKDTVTYEYKDDKWVASGTKVLRWRQNSYYGVEIVYYDDNNERVNSEIVEHSKMHQHFFQLSDIKGIRGNTNSPDAKSIVNYLYRDTDPEDKYYKKGSAVKLLEEHTGLKGYFKVNENYLTFNLKISLSHFVNGDKTLNGKQREWYQYPSGGIADTEFQVKVPVRIYTNRLSEDATYEDMAKEFGITEAEAEAEIDRLMEADVDPESNHIWM